MKGNSYAILLSLNQGVKLISLVQTNVFSLLEHLLLDICDAKWTVRVQYFCCTADIEMTENRF